MQLSFDIKISPSLTPFPCHYTSADNFPAQKVCKVFIFAFIFFPSFLCRDALWFKSLKNIRIKAFSHYIWYGWRKTQGKSYRKHSSCKNSRPKNQGNFPLFVEFIQTNPFCTFSSRRHLRSKGLIVSWCKLAQLHEFLRS